MSFGNTAYALQNLPDIQGAWRAYKEKKIKLSPQNTLRASSIGQPCDRYHYYSIKNWQDRPLHDAVMQSIFDEGNLHEPAVIQDLQKMGFEVVEQQRSFQIDKPKITGHIDGLLRWEGQNFPFDVKTIGPYDFPKINAVEDLIYSKKTHQRQYPAQLQIYLLQCEQERGLLLFKNKLTGEIKPIWMEIDYDFAEQLLKRAERVYAALEAQKIPDRIQDFDVCKKCAFRELCLPDLKHGAGVQLIDDAELSGLLDRYHDLKALAEEFEDLEDTIKDSAKASGEGEKVCGDFLIKVTQQKRKNKVAITFREEEISFLVAKIIKLNSEKKEKVA